MRNKSYFLITHSYLEVWLQLRILTIMIPLYKGRFHVQKHWVTEYFLYLDPYPANIFFSKMLFIISFAYIQMHSKQHEPRSDCSKAV